MNELLYRFRLFHGHENTKCNEIFDKYKHNKWYSVYMIKETANAKNKGYLFMFLYV